MAFRFIAANDHPDHDTIATFRQGPAFQAPLCVQPRRHAEGIAWAGRRQDQGRSPRSNWPDILRSTATMVAGIMPPSQLLRKFASYPRQHDLALALREIGRI